MDDPNVEGGTRYVCEDLHFVLDVVGGAWEDDDVSDMANHLIKRAGVIDPLTDNLDHILRSDRDVLRGPFELVNLRVEDAGQGFRGVTEAVDEATCCLTPVRAVRDRPGKVCGRTMSDVKRQVCSRREVCPYNR